VAVFAMKEHAVTSDVSGVMYFYKGLNAWRMFVVFWRRGCEMVWNIGYV